MTRPNILRADTLDLQEESTPGEITAKHPPAKDGNAPHVAAQVHHVLEERHSEEQALADAWNISSNIADDPAAIDQAQASNDTDNVAANGTAQKAEAAGEGGDTDTDADDDMMDRISSSPSIDDEDIDFEFVYALHTFVATVEGQANATKGDTMVLLDDSNSYWWLVRVVKDSSIGYLPAEHIETPTERLARLNKHRNIDLSATMLSDNSEKSRNPLKKAMRRRNAKTVQFAAPTYVEASDYDYDTEDEEAQMIDPYANAQQTDATATDDPDEIETAGPKAEAKHPEAEGRSSTSSQRASFDREQAATAAQALAAAGVTSDDPDAPKLVDKTGEYERFGVDAGTIPTVSVEAAPLKSKRKNTDSFLKDDTIETRKITLTPGLLRDDSVSRKGLAVAESPRSTASSMEPLVKTSSPTEQPDKKKDEKEKKKEKEPKKGGMLSGLFKSKKKEKKSAEAASEKASAELQRESATSSPAPSGTLSSVGKDVNGQQSAIAGSLLSSTSTEESRDTSHDSGPGNAFVAELEGSTVAHEMAAGDDDNHELQRRADADAAPQEKGVEAAQQEQSKGIISNALSPVTNAITNMVKTSDGHDKPKKAKRSKQRVELDDFDSPQDEKQDQLDQNPFSDPEEDERESERSSESPVEITSHAFMNGTDSVHIPLPSQGEEEDDSPGSLSSSPSIIEHPAEPAEEETEHVSEDSDPTPTARSPQPVEPDRKPTIPPNRGLSTDSNESSRLSPPTSAPQTWSDESFRAWLEDGSEVRDMLVMIHDKTGVTPAPADHPLMTGLFTEQRKGVQNMMGELDGLLGSYLQRKGVRF